jgi:signal transduction histidine kinase
MVPNLRKTGISIVDEMLWGTHFCCFYETPQDLLALLGPYFATGLELGEFCVWVISDPLTEEDAMRALRHAVPDLDRYLAERSIEIIPLNEWYLKGGAFDLHRVIASWNEKLDHALARGYTGMRVSGNTAWIQKKDWRDFREYEKEVDVSIANQRMIVLCTYPLTTSRAAEILDVARLHQVAVARRSGNWEIVETPELRQAKQEIKRLNEELEQRVAERTRELAAINEELRREIIERKQAEATEREQRTLAEALRDTAAALNSTLDFEEVLQRILENAGRVVPHEASAIMLLEHDYWRIGGHQGFTERGLKEWIENLRLALDQRPLLRRVVESGEPLTIADAQAYPDWVVSPQVLWIRSHISAPIRVKDTVIGVLNLHSSIPNFFAPSHAARLQAFADQAAIALENARLLQEVYATSAGLQILSRQLLQAHEAERRALARELHDEIGQRLTGLGLLLSRERPSPDQLTDAQAIVRDLIARLRNLSLDLRPTILDDLGLLPALVWLFERYTAQTNVSVQFEHRLLEEQRFEPDVEITAYRIIQEALTNVARHAGVGEVTVRLWTDDDTLTMVIVDQGRGFDSRTADTRSASGLAGMLERAALLGGSLTIEAASGGGTRLTATLPLHSSAGPREQEQGP